MFDLTETRTLLIYSDGSIAPNNIGGVGIRIISIDSNGDEIINDSYFAGYRNANSGQMEIIACTTALEEAVLLQLTLSIKNVILLTDSKYVSENYKNAMFEWGSNQWRRRTGRPLPDAHLWKDLVKQITKYNKDHVYVEIKWIKGHEKDEHNKAVDEMAKRASRLPLEKFPKGIPISAFVPRKIVPSPRMEIGSVKMKGQKISIKILACDLLKPQNIWRYQYQVVSSKSPFYGCVDQIFSKISFDINKSYFVKINSAIANPTIEKVYREIKKQSSLSNRK